jgi:hypothetical protein
MILLRRKSQQLVLRDILLRALISSPTGHTGHLPV